MYCVPNDLPELFKVKFRQPDMLKIVPAVLFLTLILAGCFSNGLSVETPSPILPVDTPTMGPGTSSTEESPTPVAIPISTTEVLPPPKLIATISTPHIDQGPDGAVTEVSSSYPGNCGYQWAYQDMPDLSTRFLQSIQALQPGAQANAFVFGENCVHADGSTTFLPMETDFNLTLQVSDLTNEADLGEWIVKVMQVIGNIPPEQISGPRPGRVSIRFEANGEQGSVAFYIDQYHALQAGLGNAEIYQTLKNSQ
jgi:hypothetical protein